MYYFKELGNLQQLIYCYSKLRKLNPKDYEVAWNLAKCYEENGGFLR